jgi:hypothetical protein
MLMDNADDRLSHTKIMAEELGFKVIYLSDLDCGMDQIQFCITNDICI